MSDKLNVSSGLLFVMFVLFMVLKLAGVITWSWLLVTLPIWICPAIVLGVLGCCMIICIVCFAIGGVILGLWGLYKFIRYIFNI